jgi:hypothetical protein
MEAPRRGDIIMTEVSTKQRRRGRPKGSGIDDAAVLGAIADTLVANDGMRPTTAMKRCVKGIGATHLRRLQVKWKLDGARLRAAALQRAEARSAAERAAAQPAARGALPATRGRSLEDAIRTLNAIHESPVLALHGRLQDLVDPPFVRRMREMDAMLRGIANSPAIQAAQRLAESPAMRAMRAITEAPLAKEAERMNQLMRAIDPLGRHR